MPERPWRALAELFLTQLIPKCTKTLLLALPSSQRFFALEANLLFRAKGKVFIGAFTALSTLKAHLPLCSTLLHFAPRPGTHQHISATLHAASFTYRNLLAPAFLLPLELLASGPPEMAPLLHCPRHQPTPFIYWP